MRHSPGWQRVTALILIATGLARCLLWAVLLSLLIFGNTWVRHEMGLITVVAGLSLYANLATDWGQVTAAYAALAASDAHDHAEQVHQNGT